MGSCYIKKLFSHLPHIIKSFCCPSSSPPGSPSSSSCWVELSTHSFPQASFVLLFLFLPQYLFSKHDSRLPAGSGPVDPINALPPLQKPMKCSSSFPLSLNLSSPHEPPALSLPGCSSAFPIACEYGRVWDSVLCPQCLAQSRCSGTAC